MNNILKSEMNYPAASGRGINIENYFCIDASIGVLNSFIPIRCAIGIIPCGHEIVRSTYKFQCTPFLKFEFHE